MVEIVIEESDEEEAVPVLQGLAPSRLDVFDSDGQVVSTNLTSRD